MIDSIIVWASSFDPIVATMILAALPVTELRLALPLAITAWDISGSVAFASAVIGNSVPALLLCWWLPAILKLIEQKFPRFSLWLDRYFRLLEQKHRASYQRYGVAALFLFVMIPLPGTGAWTASLLATLFAIKPRYAIPAIVAGVIAAGVIVLLATAGTLGAMILF